MSRERLTDAAQADVSELIGFGLLRDRSALPGLIAELVALADDDDREVLAALVTPLELDAGLLDSYGLLGMRIMSAPPAIPLMTAIQPVWRPITSTTITRLCDSAVVCRRSIASAAIQTAVSKPKV